MAPARRVRGERSGDSAATRRALLEAAKAEFAERGYDGAGTREILSRAGVTAPVLYHHFGNKAGLFEAVAREVMDVVVGEFEKVTAAGGSLQDQLEAILDASAAVQARDPELPRFVVAAPLDVARHPELASAAPEMNRLGRFFAELTQGADDLAVTPRQASDLLLTLFYGLARSAATQSPKRFKATAEGVKSATSLVSRPR